MKIERIGKCELCSQKIKFVIDLKVEEYNPVLKNILEKMKFYCETHQTDIDEGYFTLTK